jgi:hypothetical protein
MCGALAALHEDTWGMQRLALLGIALNLAALGCLALAYARVGDIGGEYFSRAVGAPPDAAVSATDSSVWFLAAGILLILGTSALARAAYRRR